MREPTREKDHMRVCIAHIVPDHHQIWENMLNKSIKIDSSDFNYYLSTRNIRF